MKGLISLVLLLLLASCFQVPAAPNQTTIRLLVTSDLHGWLSTSTLYPKRKQSGLLHLKSEISQLRQQFRDLILIDAGDMFEGSPLVHYHHHVKKGRAIDNPFLKLVNEIRYDAVVVGNHDLSLNPEFEQQYVPGSNFTWLAANAYRGKKNVFVPYLIRPIKGLKVAILGFTTPGVHMWLGPNQLQGIEIQPVAKSVKKWVRHVKVKEKPDVMLGVFHVGLNSKRDDENSKLNRIPTANSLRAVLEQTDAFDLVISGHDHHLHPYKSGQDLRYVSGTPVLSPGHSGRAALLVKIDLERQRQGWLVKTTEVSIKKPQFDREIESKVSLYAPTGYHAYLNERLPWLLTAATRKDIQSCINHLLAVSCDEPGLDGTFFSSVSVIGKKQATGRNLIRADLFRWIKYDNKSALVLLSQRDVFLLSHPEPEYGKRTIPYNRILIPWFKRDFPKEFNHFWLQEADFEKKFRFKLTDYHFWGGGGLRSKLFIEKDDLIKLSSRFQRDNLFNYLKSAKVLPNICQCFRYRP